MPRQLLNTEPYAAPGAWCTETFASEEDTYVYGTARHDAQQNKGMSVNPNWTSAEKERYVAAYNGAKKGKK